jgi:hypothetical protein
MKRRVVAFTLVWAYVACALWLSRAVNHADTGLYFFPPGYFFVVGLMLGLPLEALAARWSRLWVTPAILALSMELAILLHGGHSVGALLLPTYPGIARSCSPGHSSVEF